jgi:hypothetical protein
LGPVSLEVGDQVWAIKRAMYLAVLRELRGATFTLVGETCLHGFIDSQMKQRAGNEITNIAIE